MLSARKLVPATADPAPWLALVANTVSDPQAALRDPVQPDNVLQTRTIKWLTTLPADLRPIATGQLYPRIVNKISDLWSQCEYTRLYFQSLLIDRRKGRRGFPPEVKAELEALQMFYFEQHSRLDALLWNAVPVKPPRIPNTVFPPFSDRIELLPL